MALTTRDNRVTDTPELAREWPELIRPSAPTPMAEPRDIPLTALITIASGAMLVIGSLLPWTTATFASIGTVTRSGLAGFGIVTLILGLIVVAGGLGMLTERRSSIARIVAVTTAVAAAYVASVSFTTAQALVESVNLGEFAVASMGIGLLLVVAGAIGSLIGAGGNFVNNLVSSAS
jgi:hypothetical protein